MGPVSFSIFLCFVGNLALHSPTSISSVHISEGGIRLRHGNGSLAVNGEVRFDDTECSITTEENLPFLTIDLLNEFFVGTVIFTNRGSSGIFHMFLLYSRVRTAMIIHFIQDGL